MCNYIVITLSIEKVRMWDEAVSHWHESGDYRESDLHNQYKQTNEGKNN